MRLAPEALARNANTTLGETIEKIIATKPKELPIRIARAGTRRR